MPAVQVVASGALFRRGLLLSSGDAIERLSEIDVVVFDKTGTLTLPQPVLVNRDEIAPELVERAARLAISSHHPLARALAGLAQLREPYDDVQEQAGAGVMTRLQGMEMRLGSAEFCAAHSAAEAALMRDPDASLICFRHVETVAVFRIRQSLRPDAIETVRALKALNLPCLILSGDRAASVEPVAQALQISDWRAGMKPQDKIAVLDELKASGKRVLMVGDGINDAPALAAAHVSLSPITGSDLAQASSDAVFMGDRLSPVLMAVKISRRARALMRQNLWMAAIYNLFAVPLAIAGYVTPLIAAAAMSGSSILVTLNALRGNAAKEVV